MDVIFYDDVCLFCVSLVIVFLSIDGVVDIVEMLIYLMLVSGWVEVENVSGVVNNEVISVVIFNIEIFSCGLF